MCVCVWVKHSFGGQITPLKSSSEKPVGRLAVRKIGSIEWKLSVGRAVWRAKGQCFTSFTLKKKRANVAEVCRKQRRKVRETVQTVRSRQRSFRDAR